MSIALTQNVSLESAATTLATLNANWTAITNKFAGAILNADVAANADIDASKLLDASIISRKFKPTCGIATCSGDLSLTTGWQDVAGCTATFVAATASYAIVFGMFDMDINTSTIAQGRLDIDGSTQTTNYAIFEGDASYASRRATVSQVWYQTLTAASHTIKLQAISSAGGGACKQTHTQMFYLIISQ